MDRSKMVLLWFKTVDSYFSVYILSRNKTRNTCDTRGCVPVIKIRVGSCRVCEWKSLLLPTKDPFKVRICPNRIILLNILTSSHRDVWYSEQQSCFSEWEWRRCVLLFFRQSATTFVRVLFITSHLSRRNVQQPTNRQFAKYRCNVHHIYLV